MRHISPPQLLFLLAFSSFSLNPLAFSPSAPHVFTSAFPASRISRSSAPRPLKLPEGCKEKWFKQELDHFNWANASKWNQRYFICDKDWQSKARGGKGPRGRGAETAKGPIFFYTGNEGDVELYLTHTGLMFENAASFGALLIFAEHRYYGKSQPLGAASGKNLRYLTHEQALADYSTLLTHLKRKLKAEQSPVIAFGGSYGGMLSAWFRMKYPHVVTGAVAASAPVLAFDEPNGERGWDNEKYWEIVTRDASPEAGAVPDCVPKVRQSWDVLFEWGESDAGRKRLDAAFKMCAPLASTADVQDLALFIAMAWDTMAMGNFPYPSSYLSGDADLPPWPVRAACKVLETESVSNPVLVAMNAAIGVFYNASGKVDCLELPQDKEYDGIWDYQATFWESRDDLNCQASNLSFAFFWQWCTELLPQESYFERDGKNDMFYPFSMPASAVDAHCLKKYGVKPRRGWIATQYGGLEGIKKSSNIVFSNGGLDPWSSGGVNSSLSDSLTHVFIPEGAHHLDLFFSNPMDPVSVKEARTVEMMHVRTWINQYYKAQGIGFSVPQPRDFSMNVLA